MKFYTLATLAVISAQNTSVSSSNTDVATNNPGNAETTKQRISNQLEILAASDPNLQGHEQGDKALTQADMGLLSNYGCWCFFETAHGKGKGKPVDEIDSFCKTLHDGYECILADANDAGVDCVPWEVSYNSAFGSGIPGGLTLAGLAAECDVQNTPDTCQAWTCKVEGWFVQQYFLYSTSGGLINAANRHENGFDQDVGCPISTGIQSEKACCGSYPLRFPYKTYDGARDCCSSHTFNTNLFVCCADGHVRMTC